ncbi:MAG: sigma-54 interaction domain-containing protein [Bacteroidales bacterium]
MLKNYQSIVDNLRSGVLITNTSLEILFMNDFAEKLLADIQNIKQTKNLQDYPFHTTEQKAFDMHQCKHSMKKQKKQYFHKTLIVKTPMGERLIYFSSQPFRQENTDFFLFQITDISDEMECLTQSPDDFGKSEYYLEKKIIGHDEKIRKIYRMISLAAESDVNVMILGESGTGKELVADAIHELSYRKNEPFIKINCASLSDTLLESELFGHVKGAFTDAWKDKLGKFELAQGGTIFLDEIGEISPALQVKLLRVIQEKTIERVGDNQPVKVNMRIIAATNKNLRQLIRENAFREDLFYRLSVFNIQMPPLRERHLDIPALTDFFINKFNESTLKKVKGIGREALKTLMEYDWPGNVRELQNAIEHAFVLVDGATIESADLPPEISKKQTFSQSFTDSQLQQNSKEKEETINTVKKNRSGRLNITKEQLENVLSAYNHNQSKTAKHLNISRVALWKKIKKLGIDMG